jgi:site-specific DNA recombinase
MRVLGYVRVSTEDQGKKGVSPAEQESKIVGYCDLYEHQLIGIESDLGVSAKSLDRPALKLQLDRLDRGDADGLIVAKLDRLSRNIRDWGALIEDYFGQELTRARRKQPRQAGLPRREPKKLLSVAEAIDTGTASGRMGLNVLMVVSQWEREATVERTRDGLAHKIKLGERVGRVLYGKAIDPDDPRRSVKSKSPNGLMPCPAELEAIALMEELKAEGRSLRAIADELTRRGIPTREGGERWQHSSVRKILGRAG